jgi:hypothetical protein
MCTRFYLQEFIRSLYEWLSRIADTQFEIISRPPVVWTSALIKKFKKVDNVVSRAVDLWYDSTIGGYITEFFIDRVESYSQVERYFFKGPRGKLLRRNLQQGRKCMPISHSRKPLSLTTTLVWSVELWRMPLNKCCIYTKRNKWSYMKGLRGS